ncbi:unnamed protein product [Oncorhynchus mykiss]|uniref:C2H2-type domain-containing protein n=1 Tax=Oncorhynchus mykiss TaxID=8022 RepID=A0A060X0T2_ONCMY|nr:unnamed protein product [Oncorhynchus mykiss]
MWQSAEAAGPGVKQGRTEEEDPQHSRDIQTGVTGAPPVATEDPTPVARRSITEVLNSNDQRAKAWGGGATSGNSKEKRFLCMFCNKGFSSPQKVEVHQRVHTGEKPYSCTQCHMRFAQSGSLKRHQMVHTGEKPYSCPQCEKRFSRQEQLKMHLKVHMV